eukprot:CAMPEP_0119059494 /NCGR_PEP_ID=MMETSP1178-20130426/3647_1 /TAXON_ID=33656 /ORGANISM="unid sp, Strain CCMP2000" /LENGTH=76 /DNA_ID=CAMNT_0007040535 /DNA_START=431 /DNA_END=657 /DNA_ORIENTATION=-
MVAQAVRLEGSFRSAERLNHEKAWVELVGSPFNPSRYERPNVCIAVASPPSAFWRRAATSCSSATAFFHASALEPL